MSLKIVGALLVGFVLIGSSLWLTYQPTLSKDAQNSPDITPTRTDFTVTDSDGDAVPDWLNSLVVTTVEIENEPFIPKTVTEKTAVSLVEELLQNENNNPVSLESLKQKQLETTTSILLDTLYTPADIYIIEDNSTSTWRRYGLSIAEIIIANSPATSTESELTHFNRALQTNNPNILEKIDPILEGYQGMRDDMLSVAVPSELVGEHLALTNVYQGLVGDIEAFSNVFEDAIPALVRLERYPLDAAALYTALNNIYLKLDEAEIQWSESDPVNRVVDLE